ncbi:MAG: YiiD C-terminal domain-containing protein [Spongiibacteraceae bacterium]
MPNTVFDDFVSKYLPAAQHMQLKVEGYDGNTLSMYAPLGPNINDKLTAFGGSLYCVSVMACWGMVYLRCVDAGLDPDIVVAKAEIEYLRPVPEDIVSTTISAGTEPWQQFFTHFEERGRAKIELCSEIHVNGECAVRFKGLYALVGLKSVQ